MDLYELLDVARDATPGQIKSAYKKASTKHHPDKGGDSEIFKQVKQAYEILSDPEQRELYDTTGVVSPKRKIDLEEMAMSRILIHIQGWYSLGNLDIDPIDMVKSHLANELNSVKQKLNNIEQSGEFIRQSRDRITSKKDNFILAFVDSKVRDLENIKVQAELEKLQIEKANQMIEDFSWKESEEVYRAITFNTGTTQW